MEVGLIGAGNMARALARGWAESLLLTDGGSGRARALAAEVGGEVATSNAELAERCRLVVLCHKPAQTEQVAAEIGDRARLLISVLAGVALERLRAAYPRAEVVRAMPNTAVEVRQGVTCLAVERDARAEGVGGADGTEGGDLAELARARFERVGEVVDVPEHLMELATAISGVAPAYLALVAEAQVEAAVGHGVPIELARQLVAGGLAGSAALLAARGMDTLGVRAEVASPGGMTVRGLAALESAGVRGAFDEAMDAVAGKRDRS
jgi:pyrroline-5-carboxylate reductase